MPTTNTKEKRKEFVDRRYAMPTAWSHLQRCALNHPPNHGSPLVGQRDQTHLEHFVCDNNKYFGLMATVAPAARVRQGRQRRRRQKVAVKVGMNPRPLAVSTHHVRVSATPTTPGSVENSAEVSIWTAQSILWSYCGKQIITRQKTQPLTSQMHGLLQSGFRNLND